MSQLFSSLTVWVDYYFRDPREYVEPWEWWAPRERWWIFSIAFRLVVLEVFSELLPVIWKPPLKKLTNCFLAGSSRSRWRTRSTGSSRGSSKLFNQNIFINDSMRSGVYYRCCLLILGGQRSERSNGRAWDKRWNGKWINIITGIKKQNKKQLHDIYKTFVLLGGSRTTRDNRTPRSQRRSCKTKAK